MRREIPAYDVTVESGAATFSGNFRGWQPVAEVQIALREGNFDIFRTKALDDFETKRVDYLTTLLWPPDPA